MQISYLVTMEQALNFLSNQGLDGATNENYENNIKLYRLAAHDKISEYLGFEVVSTVYTEERYMGLGLDRMFLVNRPITTLTKVQYSDVEQTITDFEIIKEKYIYTEDGVLPYSTKYNLKIDYTAGYTQASMPSAIRLAALQLIALYQGMNGGAGTTIGKGSISDGQGGSESMDLEAEGRILESIVAYQKIC